MKLEAMSTHGGHGEARGPLDNNEHSLSRPITVPSLPGINQECHDGFKHASLCSRTYFCFFFLYIKTLMLNHKFATT